MNVIFAAYCYIATIVGAGFASGQEILSFFVVYDKWGIFGIIFACTIFGIYATVIIEGCRILHAEDYNSLLEKIMSKSVMKFSQIITFIFMCAVYCAMVACMGETVMLLWGCNPIWGRLAVSFVCLALLMAGNNASLRINGILGVIIVLGMISVTVYMLRFREHQTFLPQIRAVVSGAGYSGYNLLGAGVVAAGFSKSIKSRKEAISVGIISGTVLFVMMMLVWALLSLYYKYISLGEIPMLTMALRQNGVVVAIYCIMLALSIITTAVSSGFGISDMIKKSLDNKRAAILIMLGGICISGIGFSSIVNIVYRLCGYIGILVNLLINFDIIKKNKEILRKKKI